MSIWIAVTLLIAAAGGTLVVVLRRAGAQAGSALAVALAVSGLGLGLYAVLGEPDLPDLPHSARIAEAHNEAQMNALLDELETRLKADPNRADGWVLLGRSRMKLEDYAKAAQAFARARALAPGDPAIAAEFAEASIHAENGAVSEDARAALTQAHMADPTDAKTLFYLGHDASMKGDHHAAAQYWTDLVAVSPPDAPWVADLRERVQAEAAAGNFDPASVKPSVAPPPQMTAEDIRAMVERLATRLEAEPDDPEGWARLANAWRVLGETDKAAAAEARGKEAAAKK
jgi:cytochrome c-type biogenesis protein CcmH